MAAGAGGAGRGGSFNLKVAGLMPIKLADSDGPGGGGAGGILENVNLTGGRWQGRGVGATVDVVGVGADRVRRRKQGASGKSVRAGEGEGDVCL